MPDATSDELYVGYLKTPPPVLRFLSWLIPAVVCGLSACMLAWALTQPSPGTGVWEDGRPVQLRGTLVARPYPMLLLDSPSETPEVVLLVEVGKLGVARETEAWNGRAVVASGWPLHRSGRRMLELEPEPAALVLDSSGTDARVQPQPLGPAKLRGEIVDSKCYLGAMKPGEGKTHKECATLCIRGGIPPMLVSFDVGRTPTFTLISGPDGGPLQSDAHPFVGDLVEASGELFRLGNLRILRVAAPDLRRL